MSILTLSTDIGLNDYLAGAIKGQLLSAVPAVQVVDITHNLSTVNYPQAAYICSNAYKYFPRNTFHLIVVNLFEKPVKHFLIAYHNEQFICCPDNGILTMIAGKKPEKIVAVPVQGATTLDYTAQLAKVYSALQKEGAQLQDAGADIKQIEEKYPPKFTIGSDWIEGQIIFIDSFENVVVNITKEEFEEQRKGRKFKIVFMRNETIETLGNNYTHVEPGEKLAWFNSAGYLEIAVNKGNMAGLFGLQNYSDATAKNTLQNTLFYKTVKVLFEG
ncbi:MAG: SAM-dependent chlorinase/fluorinase [Chitinophagaceae bacterium]|jgi:S-adenosylmethionine hydrolase|nr:SAM-dependent chlorinase/fluorinase [Chitinophagaceae bacterium]